MSDRRNLLSGKDKWLYGMSLLSIGFAGEYFPRLLAQDRSHVNYLV